MKQLAAGAAVCAALLIFLYSIDPRGTLWIDFVEYWAAARLLLAGGNPYDSALLAQLQQQFIPGSDAIMMWNPPVVFPFTLPFALLEFRAARLIWVFLSLALMGVVAVRVVSLNLKSGGLFSGARLYGVVFAVLFPGFFYCFAYGQIGPLLLLGLWGFWSLSRGEGSGKRRNFAAGAALSLTLIKPHLLYLLYAYLVLNIRKGRYAWIVLGLSSAAVAQCALVTCLAPGVFAQYLEAISRPPLYWQTPTLGGWTQWFIGEARLSARMLPAIVSLALLAAAFMRNSVRDCESTLAIIVCTSLLFAPFGWTFDQVLLFPAVIWAFGRVSTPESPQGLRLLVIGGAIAGSFGALVIPGPGMQSLVWYPALCLLLVCLAARYGKKEAIPRA